MKNVNSKLVREAIWKFIFGKCTKESFSDATNVSIKQKQSPTWMFICSRSMRYIDFIVTNVTTKWQRKEIWMCTNRRSTKEFNRYNCDQSFIQLDCDQCEYKVTQKFNLRMHVQLKHEGFVYRCDQCDYKASYKHAFRIHKQSIHEDIKFDCEQWEYKATKRVIWGSTLYRNTGEHIWLWSMWIQSNHQKSSKSAYTIEAWEDQINGNMIWLWSIWIQSKSQK